MNQVHYKYEPFTGAAASADVTEGGPQNTLLMAEARHASVHVVWSGLDAVDATAAVLVSNNGTDWDTKNDASNNPVQITLSSPNGNKLISLNDVVTEDFYTVKYLHGTNTQGKVSCIVVGKG